MNLNPAALALRYRRLTFIILILFLGLGLFNFLQMPRQEDPDFNPSVAQITTVYPGASPEQVETLISKPLEEKINELDNLAKVNSYSNFGFSSVIIELEEGADVDKTWEDLREKVNQAKTDFPSEAKEPNINTDLLKTVTTLITIEGASMDVLESYAKNLEKELEDLTVVASVIILGLPKEEVQISIPAEKLGSYPISLGQILNLIRGNTAFLQGSTANTGDSSFQVETLNKAENLEHLKNMIIYTSPEGQPLYLGDVADISLSREKQDVFVRTNGNQALSISVFMKENKNVIDFGKAVHQEITEFQKTLPPEIKLTTIADQPTTVGDRLNLFTSTLITGMVLVWVVVFLGLGWKNAFVIFLAVPISTMLAFTFAPSVDLKLHQVSIMGLVIALGMLVDNAIVVNDNIFSHYISGKDVKESATLGVKEVEIPIASSTLTTIAAFVPLMFIGGDIGAYIVSIPQMVTFTLIASLLVALTITPLFTTFVIKNKIEGNKVNNKTGGLSEIFLRFYQRILKASLNKPKITIVLACLVLLVSIAIIPLLDTAFFPPAGRDLLIVEVNTPQDTKIEATKDVLIEVEKLLSQQPEVKDYTAYLGVGMPKFFYNIFPSSGNNVAQILVNTYPKSKDIRGIPELMKDLRKEVNNIAGARIEITELEQGPPVGAPVNIRVIGPELSELERIATDIANILKEIPGTINPSHSLDSQSLQLQSTINRDKASLVGISSYEVSQYIRALNDGIETGTYYLLDDELDIKLSLTSDAKAAGITQQLKQIPIYSTYTGNHILLGSIAELKPSWQPVSIPREDGTRYVNVTSYVEEVTADEVLKEAMAKIKGEVDLPEGYSLETGGEFEEKAASFTSLARAGITAIVMIYFILVFQFNSLIQPLLIVTSIPFVLIGSIFGLLLTNNPLGFMAFLGIVSLVGIVVNNAIVLVDFINMQRAEGVPLREAIYLAAERRLRPVVLTTATTIGGLLPLSLTGGALWSPMGFTIVFGLLSSTVLTLLMLPAMYYLVEGYLEKRNQKSLKTKENNLPG